MVTNNKSGRDNPNTGDFNVLCRVNAVINPDIGAGAVFEAMEQFDIAMEQDADIVASALAGMVSMIDKIATELEHKHAVPMERMFRDALKRQHANGGMVIRDLSKKGEKVDEGESGGGDGK